MADMRTVYGDRRRPGWDSGTVPVAFVLATAHVSLLVLAVVIGLQSVEALGDLLSALSTLPGLGAFAVLWVLTWVVTRRTLERVSMDQATHPGGVRTLLVAGIMGGGLLGVAVVVLPVLRFAIGALVDGNLWPAVLVVVIGIGVGGLVGAVVGG
ncbi:MAG: hypothetical protein R3324_19525, partial [Halobacteriales archaeon]|nr:hypothetical protein [Halobacteriales archaeon]